MAYPVIQEIGDPTGERFVRRRIAILSVTRKNGGLCIVGKTREDPRQGAWIRLVSEEGRSGLSQENVVQACGGQLPECLDVFSVPLLGADPRGYQSENWVPAPGQWHLHKRVAKSWLRSEFDSPDSLWENGHSSGKGMNDCVPVESLLGRVCRSIVLIKPEGIRLARADGAKAPKVRARFTYKGEKYDLCVTDPRIRSLFASQAIGIEVPHRDVALCVSLGSPLNELMAYKLVLGVLDLSNRRIRAPSVK